MIDVLFRVVCITIISVNIQHIEINITDRLSVLVKLDSSSRLRRPPVRCSRQRSSGVRGLLESVSSAFISFRLLAYALS